MLIVSHVVGWIAKLDVSDSSEYKKLLSKEDYDKLLSDSI